MAIDKNDVYNGLPKHTTLTASYIIINRNNTIFNYYKIIVDRRIVRTKGVQRGGGSRGSSPPPY